MFTVTVLFVLGLSVTTHSQTLECNPNPTDLEAVSKVVFTYGKGLTELEKTGIAFTILNRAASPYFPNTTEAVVNWECLEYNRPEKYYAKLEQQNQIREWNHEKQSNSYNYETAIRLSRAVLCGEGNDITNGATDFSLYPMTGFFRAPRSYVAGKPGQKLGALYFFKIKPNDNGDAVVNSRPGKAWKPRRKGRKGGKRRGGSGGLSKVMRSGRRKSGESGQENDKSAGKFKRRRFKHQPKARKDNRRGKGHRFHNQRRGGISSHKRQGRRKKKERKGSGKRKPGHREKRSWVAPGVAHRSVSGHPPVARIEGQATENKTESGAVAEELGLELVA